MIVPETADVVVIGGGIVGCATAYVLAVRGVSVAVCEKGRVAGEQSGRNWGWIRQQGRHPAELPMMAESMRMWRQLAERLGEDIGFEQGGCIFLARDRRELEEHAAWLPTAREFQLDTRLLTAGEMGGLIEDPGERWAGALYTPSDCRAEPEKASVAIARAAQEEGATVLAPCAVRGLDTEGGRVSAVVTEHGPIRTSRVVCAAGAWTSLFSGSLGIVVPQLKVTGTVARTARAPNITEGATWAKPVALRRRQDGGYTVALGNATEHPIVPASFRFFRKFLPTLRAAGKGVRLRLDGRFLEELATRRKWPLDQATPFESARARVLEPPPSHRILSEMRANLSRWFPQLAGIEFAETWAGMIETSPDGLPIISPVDGLEGYYVATGFSGHGFGLGPGAGRAIADMVCGNDPGLDMTPFRLGRFFDGTPIQPAHGI